MTFFELTEGDLASGTEFAKLPEVLLRKSLDVLVKSGRAQVFEGTERGEGEGAKFV